MRLQCELNTSLRGRRKTGREGEQERGKYEEGGGGGGEEAGPE